LSNREWINELLNVVSYDTCVSNYVSVWYSMQLS